MENLNRKIELLALFSIFFIYKMIMGVLENNISEISLWMLILIVYLVSLLILYLVLRKKKNLANMKNK